MIHKKIGHFQEKSGNRYLVLDDVDENKKVSKLCKEVWEGVIKEIETINGGKKLNMEKILKKLGLSLMMICHWINL